MLAGDRERVRQPRRAARARDWLLELPAPRRSRRVREGAVATRSRAATTQRVARRADRALRRPRAGASATGPRSRSARSPTQDTPTLRDALAARLDDGDESTRIEAVHGLALRGDARALDATLDLLGEVGPHDDGGNAADTIWKRYALTQATVRLAALTGDARLKEHLPALDERLMGTAIEGDLRTAYDRVGDRTATMHLDPLTAGRDGARAAGGGSRPASSRYG